MWNFQKCGWILGIFLLVTGCFQSTIYIVPDITPYVHQRVALLVAKLPSSIEPALFDLATQKVEARLSGFVEFSQFFPRAEVDQRFGQNTELKYKSVQYAATLALTGISDKNISSQIGKTLQVDQLFVIQADRLPCLECESGQQLIVKCYLVEAQTSKLLWRGSFQQKLDAEEIQTAALEAILLEATHVILDELVATFKIRWFVKRYNNLKKLETAKNQQPSS